VVVSGVVVSGVVVSGFVCFRFVGRRDRLLTAESSGKDESAKYGTDICFHHYSSNGVNFSVLLDKHIKTHTDCQYTGDDYSS
jgi:hypothetical protein